MLKLAIIFSFTIIAASCSESSSNNLNIPGLISDCNESCVRTLQPMLDMITAQKSRLSACEKSETNAEQTRIENQLDDLHTKIEAFASTYEKIGFRFFYIEKRSKQNWFGASNICRQKGGYLANIGSAEEMALISTRLNKDYEFWLDINDMSVKGEYISTSSGNLAPFLDWHDGEPISFEDSRGCVSVINNQMKYNLCASKNYFICQADSK